MCGIVGLIVVLNCKLWGMFPVVVLGWGLAKEDEWLSNHKRRNGVSKMCPNAMGYYFNIEQSLRLSLQELLLSKERGMSSFYELYLR